MTATQIERALDNALISPWWNGLCRAERDAIVIFAQREGLQAAINVILEMEV